MNEIFQLIVGQKAEFQASVPSANFQRQFLLYNDDEHFYQLIEEHFGLTASDLFGQMEILNLYVYCCRNSLHGLEYSSLLGTAYFDSFTKGTTTERDVFLTKVSTNPRHRTLTRRKLEKASKVKSPAYHLYDAHRLSMCPIVHYRNKHYVWNSNLLNVFMRYGVYDLLKQKVKGGFTRKFGTAMERYVRKGLECLQEEFNYDERNDSKTCDFQTSGGVFIECKAIEKPLTASVDPTVKNHEKYLNQIYKALDQVEETIVRRAVKPARSFVVVVTYKDLHLSLGKKSVARLFPPDEVPSLFEMVSPHDFLFLSLEDWDKLVGFCVKQNMTLYQMLVRICDNEQIQTKAYISQHLHDLYGTLRPEHLPYLQEVELKNPFK